MFFFHCHSENSQSVAQRSPLTKKSPSRLGKKASKKPNVCQKFIPKIKFETNQLGSGRVPKTDEVAFLLATQFVLVKNQREVLV